MAVQNVGNVFVVKDRLEALEARIESALDEAGLKDFSKQVAKEAISELIEETIEELQRRKVDLLDEVNLERINVDDRLRQTESGFDVAIADHVSRLESSMLANVGALAERLDRLETLVRLSLVGALVAMLLSVLL